MDLCARESRERLLDLAVGVVEDLHRERVGTKAGAEGFSADFQICLPYRGVFVWQVGGHEVVGDANQIIFVRGGESYRMRSPLPDGYSELIITPQFDTLAEIAHARGQRLMNHPLFSRRRWRAQPGLQRFRAQVHHWALADRRHGLEAEEVLLALIRSALQQGGRQHTPNGTRTTAVIQRAKEFLAAHLSTRLLLADVARAAGASPAYLTDLFTRAEGVPLHQYLTQLRLAHALIELRHASDLTALALDLGFSSHSHFTFVFRRAFGCTPSQFRELARRARRPHVPKTNRVTMLMEASA
jgi:AraC family transcriptional regulator